MGKNNYHLKNIKEGTKVESYSIKKFKVGAASVVIGASIFFGAGAVAQASESVSNNTVTDESLGTEKKLEVAPKAQAKPVVENTRESVSAALASKLENSEKETLNKVALTKLIEEIDGKFTDGKYTSKTEESVNQLKVALEEAKSVLNNAKSQDELSQAQAKLVVATTKLQTKPEEKKEAPAVDTTNGKATVGKKATNTEKSSESNSIANSGSRDERNGKVLDKNNPFRTDTTPSTTDDTSANQVFDNPAEGADLTTLSNKLKTLPENIQNNGKIQNMDELGNAKNVDKGQVLEIDEFGGWRAVSSDGQQGRFAIARKTDRDVFPVETINTTNNQYDTNRQIWLREQSFDRTSKYMLFLTKVRSYKNSTETAYDNSNYVRVGEGGASTAKAVKGFQGIEKTFRAYSSNDGSRIKIAFKTGYSGDINNTKAGYKVEVYSIGQDGAESSIYTTTFYPQNNVKDKDKTVVAAKDGTTRNERLNANGLTENQVNEKLAEENNKPNGTGGYFTSRDIELPKGAVSYKVRISNANDKEVGLSYQSPYLGYALPVTGVDFSIEQDTKNVAKNLLQRIYNKLIEQKSEDTKWSTPETKAAYETKLTEIKNLLSSEISTTSNYKESAKSLIEKYNSLNNRDTIVAAAKAALAQAVEAEKNEINADNSLTSAEKADKVKAVEAKKTEEEAKIAAAENADKVAEAKTAGEEAVKAVHNNGDLEAVKTAAKAALAQAVEAEKNEINADNSLTSTEKADKVKAVEAKKTEEEAKIAAAENADKVAEAKTAGEEAVKAVHDNGDLEAVKTAAKAEVDAALAEKEKAIEANNKLSDAEKAAAKAEAKKAADEAKKAIEAATDQAGVDAKATEGTKAVAAVNPVGKEKAKAAVDAALAEKAKAIEANDKLSDAEKQAAKDEAKKAADEAKKAIEAATDQAGVDAKATEGTKAVAAVNPVGKEKAQAAVDAALAEKTKAIEANDKLSDAEKQAAKDEAKKAADEAKKAIEAATDQAGVDAKATEGTKAVEAVNPVGKEKAKAEVEGELAKKLAELENSTDLTDAEKATTKTRVLDEAKKAIEAIEKATTQEEVEQAIRNFVYHISAVVLEKEEYDLSKLFVNGTVIVKQGEVLTDKDILSKLNLPEGVEVVKVEKPETVVLGKGTAKVTLKLADGTQVTITVPVEVVEGSTTSGITKLSSEVVKTGETEESSNKVSNKQLPNTGTTETNTGLAGLGLAMITGLFAVARRRKEK